MVWGTLGLAASSLAATPAAAATPCEAMGSGSRIGTATVVLAQDVPAGDYSGSDGVKITGLPSFCRIFAVANPHPSSRILIEIWMPATDKWNGKLLGIGNGGAAGKISPTSLAGGLRRGFAAATTDLGSYPAGQTGIGFNFGDGRPEAVRDWAYRATHEMTLLAKDVVLRYYGRKASKAYFVGCSTGGHQGLSEAQKYPDDYDGIIAGAPAHNRTRLHIRFAALRQLGMQPGAAISTPLITAWQQSIIKACGGRDGGAPGDKFLTNPLQCTISPRPLACKPGAASDSCLSQTQVRALEKIYAGTRNPRTGELIYFGDVLGSEPQLMSVYGDTALSRDFNITHWSLPPDRASESFDFDRDMTEMDDRLAVEVNAMDPDLSRFAARGGKLIIHHGWADGLITATDSLDYYQRMQAGGLDKGSFARLFMVPGMSHCAGGGYGIFGQLAEIPYFRDATPENDLLLALDRWSEGGPAPDMILARQSFIKTPAKPGEEGKGLGMRPICAFPKIARYDGKGNPDSATSFVCMKAPVPKYARPAAVYLR
ncbi:MAG TPA: tannase/feruloyl esterase family alpha/beta hydrolase [Sphingopyxis sp.]|nr:tannase/feruloyl esterase family alpha/beta hydrolase [Sphingopyxis sp.]